MQGCERQDSHLPSQQGVNPRTTLLAIEQTLEPLFGAIGLIGEIPLSEDEEIQIETSLRELLRLSSPGEATQFLREEAPCTLACFLVWKGIRGYREGDYWEEVCQSVGLPQANWPQKWGEIFEDVLRCCRLPDFRESGGHRFVTPILIHGGIPTYCLDDFFARLVWPVVTGKLAYSGSVDDLLAEWKERPSLTLVTDKPVRRFLEQGGKTAADFLQRCLDMAVQAYDTGQIPSPPDLGLPTYVVERFADWYKQAAPETPSHTHRQIALPRYHAPEITLNVAAGCFLLSFPSQKLLRSQLESVKLKLEVQRDGALFATTPLRGAQKGEWIETDPYDLDLGAPAAQYNVTLFSGEKPLRQWTLSGIHQGQPWMICHGKSGKLLPGRTITERDFWIIFPLPWRLSPTTQALETATLAQSYQAEHFCIAADTLQSFQLTHPDGKKFSISVEQRSMPTLRGVFPLSWPRVSSENFEVYSGTPPDLLIPLPDDKQSLLERLRLTITPIGDEAWPAERREIAMKSLAETANLEDSLLTLSLSDPRLFGPTPCGRFTLQVRGRLGQDATFHLCLLPELSLNFPREALLPDPNTGSQDLFFTLESPYLEELTIESPAEIVPQESTPTKEIGRYQIRVPAENEQVIMSPRFRAGERTVKIPLDIAMPRLRWTVSGLNGTGSLQWHDKTLIIPLQELEKATEPRLLVRGDVGEELRCRLVLQGADHQSHFILKNGKGGCLLSPFLDSLQESGLPRNDFSLECSLSGEVNPRRLHLLQVETQWRVEDLQVVQELPVTEDKRIVLLGWHDSGRVKNRLLRLWNLDFPSEAPLEVAIADGSSEVQIEKPLVDFPLGHYRLEFVALDPWVASPSAVLPNPYGNNVFDLDVAEDVTVLPSLAGHIDRLLEKIRTGTAPSDLILDLQVRQVFASVPAQARRLCQALSVREERQGDSLALLRQVLQQYGEEQESFIENLAGVLLQEDRSERGNVRCLFAKLLVDLGFLHQRWGPHLKQLLLSRGDSGALGDVATQQSQAQAEILALYAQACWQSLNFAERLVQRLYAISGELVYGDQTLRKLEGIVTQNGQELLRWSCGAKRVKGETVPSWISVSLKEVVKILPRHLSRPGLLCLTATLQRAGAYGALRYPAHIATRINHWGCVFYNNWPQEYGRELRWAEDTFAQHDKE